VEVDVGVGAAPHPVGVVARFAGAEPAGSWPLVGVVSVMPGVHTARLWGADDEADPVLRTVA
jgi:hypothetical protein